jgi:hypothetical protein
VNRRFVLPLVLLLGFAAGARADLLKPRATDFAAKYEGFTLVLGPTRRLVYVYYTGTMHLLESRDGKLVEVRTRDLWSAVLRVIAVDLDGDGQDEIVGYTKDARLFVLHGTDLSDVWNTPIGRWQAITALTAGDVDQDGQLEILVIADRLLRVFSAERDQEEWKSTQSYDDTDMALGDVDGDGREELVMSGGNVYDAFYRNLEWGSGVAGGFGVDIDLFDIDNDGKMEVIGRGADGLIRIWDVDERRLKFN